jgi:release factor glutamine methyltransferase
MSADQPTIANCLHNARRRLSEAGVESSALDAEILVRHVLGLSREALFMRLPEPVDSESIKQFESVLTKRLEGYPIAYITGRREFYGREFAVSPAVLVPRPETEYLVEWSIAWLAATGKARCRVIDVGTGSGAIAVSIACETRNQHHVIASDVSQEALEIARTNRDRHGASVQFVAGSLLHWWHGTIDVITANLPYLRPDQAHEGIRFEPSIALYAGDDGFALNRALIEQAAGRLNTPGVMIMEIDPDQATVAFETAKRSFPGDRVRIERDLAGTERYLILERAPEPVEG